MKKKVLSVKNVLKILWVLYAFLSIVIFVPQIDRLLTRDYSRITAYVSLDDSWDVTINNESFRNVSLEELRFPPVRKGTEIIMQRKLPESWEIMEGALRLSVRQSAVKVFIDEEQIFEYGYDRVALGKTVGSGYEFINFPNDYQGKTLKIQLNLSEDKAFTKLESVRIYPWENAYRVLMTENRYPLFFGGFLFIFGLAVCIITVFAIVFSRKYVRLLFVSLFSIFMGLWTMCYYRVVSIYAIPLYAVSLLEYVALYLAPLPLIGYMHKNVVNLRKKSFTITYWVFFTVYTAALAVMMALHTQDIVHLAAMLPCMTVLFVVGILFFFVVIFMNFRTNRAENRLQLVGMLIIVCCTAYDLIGYGSDRYYGDSSLLNIKGMSSIGVMAFIFILSLSFYIEMTRSMMQEAERNSLIKSAYTDELTKLYNRRYCMEYMNKLQEEKSTEYTVVCFDLNNLKTVNDTFGHAKGDILIKSAAEVLDETFAEYGIVARMGGDEFIAVINTADTALADALMKRLSENIDRKNYQYADLNMSIACGYASGREKNDDIEKVYQAADDRMYENKKQMKMCKNQN